MLRTIFLIPEFVNSEFINSLRIKYDPLCDKIRPHITLVFPFEDKISNEQLADFIQKKLSGINSFEVSLDKIAVKNDYIFLLANKSRRIIEKIHSLLYEDILEKHRDKQHIYIPHITIGRFNNSDDAIRAAKTIQVDNELKCKVDTIYVEEIGPNEKSIIKLKIKLNSFNNS